MWLLNFLPDWTFSVLFFIGIALYLVTKTVKILPYSTLIQYTSIGIIFFATYFSGSKSMNDQWIKRAHDLEVKVKELETKSAEENVKVVEKVVTKKQVVKERGEDIVKYIDREVVKNEQVIKYIETCPKLPDEVVTTINKAAKP
jgi:predicted tellurium resistance membrane protein TerC